MARKSTKRYETIGTNKNFAPIRYSKPQRGYGYTNKVGFTDTNAQAVKGARRLTPSRRFRHGRAFWALWFAPATMLAFRKTPCGGIGGR